MAWVELVETGFLSLSFNHLTLVRYLKHPMRTCVAHFERLEAFSFLSRSGGALRIEQRIRPLHWFYAFSLPYSHAKGSRTCSHWSRSVVSRIRRLFHFAQGGGRVACYFTSDNRVKCSLVMSTFF